MFSTANSRVSWRETRAQSSTLTPFRLVDEHAHVPALGRLLAIDQLVAHRAATCAPAVRFKVVVIKKSRAKKKWAVPAHFSCLSRRNCSRNRRRFEGGRLPRRNPVPPPAGRALAAPMRKRATRGRVAFAGPRPAATAAIAGRSHLRCGGIEVRSRL
jgi:hypothetical protein